MNTFVTDTKAWVDLKKHAANFETNLNQLFAKNPSRSTRYAVACDSIYFDYSKQRIDARSFDLLQQLAKNSGLGEKIEAMFKGAEINSTERRAVLHTALRSSETSLLVDGHNVMSDIRSERERMLDFAAQIHSGKHLGATNQPIDTVINIGIGGSDLGPSMAQNALADYCTPNLLFIYVSNIDPTAITDVLAKANPATTLFIVASKSFTTIETMTNADIARKWLTAELGEAATEQHFAALSTNRRLVSEFGISARQTFGFWDWVGGRFSIASSIGMSLAMAIGPTDFEEFLAGMALIDHHFHSTEFHQNIPVIMALLSIWNSNFLGSSSQAIIPYSERLARFPAFLQQLEMESNGKSVRTDGTSVAENTCGVIWGEPGTNGQHAFFQLLHQGSQTIPVDFIGIAKSETSYASSQQILNANMLAQSRALAFGQPSEQPHRYFEGNRPSTTLVIDRLTPKSLGSLIALYEHKTMVMGVIWGINSFDQFGVELGKAIAKDILPSMQGQDKKSFDSSTDQLIKVINDASE